jgi:RNA polymerase sigma-70 factor (sigma-E family)
VAVSFDEFVVAAGPRLIRAARLLLRDAGEAEDLAQETLVVMFRRWRHLRDPAAADAYAYRTVVRLTRRHLRRARFRYETTVAEVADQVADLPRVGGDELTAELTGSVRDALLMLPARQREAVVLRYYLDLSVEDTSRAMGCATGTVKSQVSKALASLRSAIVDSTPATPSVSEGEPR